MEPLELTGGPQVLAHADTLASLLDDGGVLYFSNFLRRFKLDEELAAELSVEDITARTIPPDFARDKRTHHAFRITRRR